MLIGFVWFVLGIAVFDTVRRLKISFPYKILGYITAVLFAAEGLYLIFQK